MSPKLQWAATVTTTYGYDPLDRLLSASYSDGTTPTRNFIYDQGNLWGQTLQNPVGHLSEAWVGGSPLLAAEIFSYDAMERNIQNWQCTPADCGSTALKSSYGFDNAGDETWETRETVAGGYNYGLNFTYNLAQRLTSITGSISDAQHPATLASGLHYNAFGEPTAEGLGNGVQNTWQFDARGRLGAYVAGSVYNLSSIAYEPDGDVASANDSVNGNWSYRYDDMKRLASAGNATAGFSYGYDRRGNRWQQTLTSGSGPQFSSAFDLNNHMVASGYSFDAAGNVTSDANCNYSYDAESELIAVSRCTTASYTYNAFGRRVRAVTPNYTIDLVLDQQGRIADEMGANGAQWWRGEIYAGGRQLATYANGITYFTHADWLGTARARTDNTGALAESCTSLPYGDALSCGSASPSPAHFAGQVRDFESGLDYFQARHFSSSEGRFVSPDPAGLAAMDPNNPQTWNAYAYVAGNPANAVDPLGLDSELYAYGQTGKTCTLDGILTDCGSINQQDVNLCINCRNGEPPPGVATQTWVLPVYSSSLDCSGEMGGSSMGCSSTPLQLVTPGYWKTTITYNYQLVGCGADVVCQIFEGFTDGFVNGRASGFARLAAGEGAGVILAAANGAAPALSELGSSVAGAAADLLAQLPDLAHAGLNEFSTNPALQEAVVQFATGFNPASLPAPTWWGLAGATTAAVINHFLNH